MNKTVIDAHDLVRIYDEKTVPVYALNGVHLHIERGEFTAIKGPSGSGKTTLLNMIGGLDIPTNGYVEINGTNITKLKGNKLIDFRLHNIGFVFQSYNLIPVLTAKENIEFIMLLQKSPAAEREKRINELLNQVGLKDKAKKRPSELSGGQQQRVAIARSLVNDPVVILADEATGNLDTRTSYEIMALFQKLNEEGKTIVFVTHEPDIARFTSRQVIFRDGHVISKELVKDRLSAAKMLAELPVEEDY